MKPGKIVRKRIVILFDGTWQSRLSVKPKRTDGVLTSKDGSYFTNIALLTQTLKPYADEKDEDGYLIPQISLYIPGVGSGPNLVTQVTQGATGDGMLDARMCIASLLSVSLKYIELHAQ